MQAATVLAEVIGTPLYAAHEWAAVIAALEQAQGAPADIDQHGMHEADDADLRDWVSDMADRVGLDMDRMAPAMEAYIAEPALQMRADFT